MGKGGQKAQNSSYKINKFWGCVKMMTSINNTVLYICKFLRESIFFFKFYLFIYLDRGKGGRKRGRESMCGCLSCAPYWGPGLQPRHVPRLGIEPAAL